MERSPNISWVFHFRVLCEYIMVCCGLFSIPPVYLLLPFYLWNYQVNFFFDMQIFWAAPAFEILKHLTLDCLIWSHCVVVLHHFMSVSLLFFFFWYSSYGVAGSVRLSVCQSCVSQHYNKRGISAAGFWIWGEHQFNSSFIMS